MKMPTSTTAPSLSSCLPASVRDADVLIVGGGPVGSLAAAMLHHRGVRVTLIDSDPDFLTFDIHRSYRMGLHPRGTDALRAVPGLYEYLLPFSSPIKRTLPGAQYKSKSKSESKSAPTFPLFMRFRLLNAFKSFLVERTSVTALYGHRVTATQFDPDGFMLVTVVDETNQTEKDTIPHTRKFRSRLVLACDGRNSVVAQQLAALVGDNTHVRSTAGFQRVERQSTSVGLKVKSIVLARSTFRDLGLLGELTFVDYARALTGAKKVKATPMNKKKRRADFTTDRGVERGDDDNIDKEYAPTNDTRFNISLLPITPLDIDCLDGVLGTIIIPQTHSLLRLSDVDSAYEAFARNLPQVPDIRGLISRAQMQSFIDHNPGTFPPIGRRASLAAVVGADMGSSNSSTLEDPGLGACGDEETELEGSGKSNGGAVILLGDAAHWFPPDIGQGVNSGLEDVVTLMEVLYDLPTQASLCDVATAYEAKRTDDIDALLRIVLNSAVFQYDVNDRRFAIGKHLHMANQVSRVVLSRQWPRVFHPQVMFLLGSNESYRTIMGKADQTTRRMVLGAFLIGVILSAVVAIAFA